jgi:hypothetical protein
MRTTLLQRLFVLAAGVAATAAAAAAQRPPANPVVADWRLDDLRSIGGHEVTIVGAPHVVRTSVGPAMEFDGVDDGILLDANPLTGMERFTIEVLFEPAPDGPAEQRFLHFEEAGGTRRALMETRMLAGGRWALDTFLKNGELAVTLLDRFQPHAAGEWHTAALVYDGRDMSHYVDGVREMAARIAFGAMTDGRTSIGVRQNRVYWFKGRIARVRITAAALEPAEFIDGAQRLARASCSVLGARCLVLGARCLVLRAWCFVPLPMEREGFAERTRG